MATIARQMCLSQVVGSTRTTSTWRNPVGLKALTSKTAVPKRNRQIVVPTKAQAQKFEDLVADDHTKMFCYQCEQTTNAQGCTTVGVCGKTPETSALQDLLVHSLKGLGSWAFKARTSIGYESREIDFFINQAMFSTLTNVNFDEGRFPELLLQCHEYQQHLKAQLVLSGWKFLSTSEDASAWHGVPDPVRWDIIEEVKDNTCVTSFIEYGEQVGIVARFENKLGDPTVMGLVELATYGLKGLCAYLHHAEVLGKHDSLVSQEVHKILDTLAHPQGHTASALLDLCMEVGALNVKVLAMLDSALTGTYGDPEPTEVHRVPVEGKAILVSGHDLHDLEDILKLTEGTGINVYTHGEMLPAHSYPGLKKFTHLKGHYGGAWYEQKKDFAKFPGAILMTSNCILEPLSTYRDNIFTTNVVGVSGVSRADIDTLRAKEHGPIWSYENIANKIERITKGPIKDDDPERFRPVVDRALELPGFDYNKRHDIITKSYEMPVMTGFGHKTVLNVADNVVEAAKSGKLSHIFLIGGCDGSEPSRAYYSDIAKILPEDTITMTMGCAKFRLLDQEWGKLPGTNLPRLLDMGQCNDSYSAVVVAQALAEALDTDVNGLPLSLDISWFEQKAVAVLLSLLHLGVTNIRLGPRMPAFLTPEATAILVKKFGLQPAEIGSPDHDMDQMMANV